MKPVFLIDCDGTLYRGNQSIPYARELIEFLNLHHFQYLLLTNCPLHSAENLSEKLRMMDMQVPCERIVTSGMVTAYFMKKAYSIESAYVLGSDALKNEISKQGIEIVETRPEAVVIGYNPLMDYSDLSKAVQLVHGGALLFSTNTDNYIPFHDTIVPHTGSIAAAVELACGQKAVSFGKPASYMADYAMKCLSVQKDRLIMIGDRLDTDIQFACNCGIQSYLVHTDIRQPCAHHPDITPTNHYLGLNEIISDLQRYTNSN